jgi:Carboxypeptidase regulatory-like domain
MVKRIVLTIAAVLLLAPAFPLDAALALGTLAGRVVDKNGVAVADATVFVETSDGEHPHATHTDKDGHFQFERYSAGQYDLRASYDSVFTDWMKRVLVRAGKTTEVTLHLPAAVK